jgi:cobalt-zinc-cadmium efflux system membrane fusion protein
MGCTKKHEDVTQAAPPPTTIEHRDDGSLIKVDRPELFSVVSASEHSAVESLRATGTVTPDVSKTIPVISLANGRVLDVHARLGDFVRQGQLLMEVQSTDISGAFDQYLKAVNDERLARVQYERAKTLYDKGAISQAQLEITENSELDAQTDLKASEQQLRVLGVDKDHPSAAVKIYSPATGVIIAQNVTNASAAGVNLSGSSTAFTIADLSHVWILCDVYENDLPMVHLGESAEIRLNAFPDQLLTGTISGIGAVLDASLRTAKVRIEVPNPQNRLRVGMFATAVFQGKSVSRVAVPATAILHLHDRDWVFVPQGQGVFRRVEVRSGEMVSGNNQEILSGIPPGQPVAANALELQNTVNQ